MQVARRTLVATTILVLALSSALAVVTLRLRAVGTEHADLALLSRRVCSARLWELYSLLPPYRPADQRNWYATEQRLIDAQVLDMCTGLDYWASTDQAETCWIFHGDDPRSRHCFDALFDGLYFVYRFRVGNGNAE